MQKYYNNEKDSTVPNANNELFPLSGETQRSANPDEGTSMTYPDSYICSVPNFMSPKQFMLDRATNIKLIMDRMLNFKLDIEESLLYCNNSHSFDHIVDKVLLGNLHFYSYRQSATIMEVQYYPNHSVYHCFIGCGNLQHLKESEFLYMERAKLQGCRYISQAGRVGWAKALKSQGWQHSCTSMYKDVH